jgi:DNA-binding NarL/FixJ family response regulator
VVSQLVGRRRGGDHSMEDLGDREPEVPSLMAEGRTDRGIAERW